MNPNIFFSNFSGASGISRQNPGISRQKSLIPWVSRDIPNFLAPTPSRGRPPPHQKISGLKSLGLGSFFVPDNREMLHTFRAGCFLKPTVPAFPSKSATFLCNKLVRSRLLSCCRRRHEPSKGKWRCKLPTLRASRRTPRLYSENSRRLWRGHRILIGGHLTPRG